jgi:hypothetical protein
VKNIEKPVIDCGFLRFFFNLSGLQPSASQRNEKNSKKPVDMKMKDVIQSIHSPLNGNEKRR